MNRPADSQFLGMQIALGTRVDQGGERKRIAGELPQILAPCADGNAHIGKFEFVLQELKLKSADGKSYKTDCANTEGVLRIVMAVPSPKAEPLKLWLAEQGKRAIEETENPEIGFERLREIYKAKGYTDEWIES